MKSPVKIVFLDFDGVLNSSAFLSTGAHQLGDLDPVAVVRLDRLVARSGSQVVVSSAWRLQCSLPELRARLAARGFTGEVLGTTPELPASAGVAGVWSLPRCAEIRAWIAAQDEPPTGFVILDDAELEPDELGELQACFVRVDAAIGLRDEDVEAALRILDGGALTRSVVERGGR